jgi:hypothetical protein
MQGSHAPVRVVVAFSLKLAKHRTHQVIFGDTSKTDVLPSFQNFGKTAEELPRNEFLARLISL